MNEFITIQEIIRNDFGYLWALYLNFRSVYNRYIFETKIFAQWCAVFVRTVYVLFYVKYCRLVFQFHYSIAS